MVSKFIIVVQRALEVCREAGRAQAYIDDKTRVAVEWETWEADTRYDVMTIYLYTDGVIVFRYQDPDTSIEKDY